MAARSAVTHSASGESRVGANLAFAAICVIWGTTFAAIRVVIETIPSLEVLYLAVLGSVVAYTACNSAQTKLTAGQVSSYAYVNPAIAVVTGALLRSEPVTIRMIASMVIILAGVALIQADRKRAR